MKINTQIRPWLLWTFLGVSLLAHGVTAHALYTAQTNNVKLNQRLIVHAENSHWLHMNQYHMLKDLFERLTIIEQGRGT